MRLVSSYIHLHNVRFYAFHGVMEQERRVGGEFLVDMRVAVDMSEAMTTDDVSRTVNYAEVYELVKREMARPSALLEHVAGRICNALFQQFPLALSVQLTLTKLNPPMGADSEGASVELFVER